MKRVFLLATLLVITYSLYAQEHTDSLSQNHSGKQLIGFNINYYHLNNETVASRWGSQTNEENRTFLLNPYYGIFISPKYMLGVSYMYEGAKGIPTDKNLNYDQYRIKLNHIGLFGRRYFFPTDRLSFFTQAHISLGTGKFQTGENYYQDLANLRSLQAGFSLGMDYLLAKHIGVELNYGHIGFTRLTQDYTTTFLDSQDNISGTGFDFGANTFKIGVNFIF